MRDATRPIRASVGGSVERLLAVHRPQADPGGRTTIARMLVITDDGLLREAFRNARAGDAVLLAESGAMLDAYAVRRLGARER